MLTDTLTKTSDGNNLRWAATPGANDLTLGNGFGSIVWTVAIPVFDCDQLNLLLSPTWGSSTAMKLRVQWSADVSGFRWCYDTFVTTSVASAVNTVTPNTNEWSLAPTGTPTTTSDPWVILLPAIAHFMRIGVYSNGAPNAATLVRIDVERMRTNPTQQ